MTHDPLDPPDGQDDGQHGGHRGDRRLPRLGRLPLPRSDGPSSTDGTDGDRGVPAGAAPSPGLGAAVAPVEVGHARHLAARVSADRVLVALALGRQDGGGERAPLQGSDEVLVTVEEMVETIGQGPSAQVLQTARPCSVEDLHAATDRWPLLLTAYTLPAQARSLLVIPLLVRDTLGSATTAGIDDLRSGEESGSSRYEATVGPVAVVGLLVLSRDEPRPFTAPQITAATADAELVTLALLSRLARPGAEADRQRGVTNTTGATSKADEVAPAVLIDSLLGPRAHLVPQAVGLISAQDDVDALEARRRLHAEAFSAGLTVHQVAERRLRGHG